MPDSGTTERIVLGGSLSLADGVAGLLPLGPLLEYDSVDGLTLHIVSAPEADITGHSFVLELYALGAPPATAAEARNGDPIIAPTTVRPVPYVVGGGASAAGVITLRVPIIFRPGQRSRRLGLVATYTGEAAQATFWVDLFRPIPGA